MPLRDLLDPLLRLAYLTIILFPVKHEQAYGLFRLRDLKTHYLMYNFIKLLPLENQPGDG